MTRIERTGRRAQRYTAALPALLFALFLAGCGVVAERVVFDEPFKDEQVKLIRNGVTTKKEILRWFGPPNAIITKGAALPVTLPYPAEGGVHAVVSKISGLPVTLPGPDKSVAQKIPERFADSVLKKGNLYYYYVYNYTWNDVCIYVACFPTDRVLNVKRLWVLIDDQAMVIDHELQESTERTKTQEPTGGKKPGQNNFPSGAISPVAGENL